MIYPFYTLLMARGLRPGRDGATRWDSHRDKTRGNTTGNQTGGNNEKMRNVTFILGYMDYMWLYGLYVVLWVMWVICGYYPQSYIYMCVFCKFYPQSLFKHSVVHFQDIDR